MSDFRTALNPSLGTFGGCPPAVGRAGLGPRDLAPVIDHLLDLFGAARVMFGSDWPVCTLAAPYRDWVRAVKAVVSGRSDEDQRRLFHDNAVRFYALG